MDGHSNLILEWNNGTDTYHRQLLAQSGASSFDGVNIPFTLSWQNILGMLLSVLVSMITGPGGQGGANFYIPLFNVLLGFSVAEAAAISSFIVFLGCISSTLHAMAAPHPTNPSKPRIDYTTVLVMLPMLLLGVSYGVMANAILPAWLLNIFLVLLWAWSCSKLFKAFKAAYSKERKQLAAAEDSATLPAGQQDNSSTENACQDIETADGAQTAGNSANSSSSSSSSSFMCSLKASVSAKCAAFKAWSCIQPWSAMAGVAGLFVGFVGLTVVRDVATEACHPSYWAVLGVQSGCLLAGAAAVSLLLLRSNRKAGSSSSSTCSGCSAETDCKCSIQVVTDAAGSNSGDKIARQAFNLAEPEPAAAADSSNSSSSWVGRARAAVAARAAAKKQATALAFIINEEAIVWTVRKLLVVPPVMLLIGVIASMLGVGGAAFVNPIILGWGLHPQVGAGTSRLVLMLSTGSSALSFLAAGRLNIVYALVYGGINVVFTPLGIHVMDKFVAKTGHASYITLFSLIRTIIGVGVQFGLSLVPSLIALHNAPPPMLGFNPHGLCH